MKKTISLLRELEYRELSEIAINGQILDLGGDRRSGYHELIKGRPDFSVVNLNDQCGPDLNFNLEEKFPLAADSFEGILCLNVLEHIFNFKNVIEESHRVLKPDGRFIGAVPFLFNIHGSPDDYFRYTRSALGKLLSQAGFREIEIKELGGGLFSVIFQLKFGLYRFCPIVKTFYLWLDKILISGFLNKIRPGNHLSQKHLPLGYFFCAKK